MLIGFVYSTSFLNRATWGRGSKPSRVAFDMRLLATTAPMACSKQDLTFVYELARRRGPRSKLLTVTIRCHEPLLGSAWRG